MKRFIAVFLCVLMVVSMFAFHASAVELPDGGQARNCNASRAEGRSSGGDWGYAELVCTISGTNGLEGGTDTVTAVTESNVRSGLTAGIYVIAWYSDTSGGQTANHTDTTDFIPDSGFQVTVAAGNIYAYKGTAGHNVEFDKYGSWICGTTYEF